MASPSTALQPGMDGRHQRQFIAQQVTETESFRGIMPHPTHLEKYETILPGFSERLLKQQELESEHRRKMESESVAAGIEEMKTRNSLIGSGQRAALYISFGTLGLAAYAVSVGAFTTAASIAISVITALAAAFIIGGKRVKDSEDE